MVKSLIVVLRKLKILHKCTKTDLQTEKYVCSDLGSEYLLWGFDQNDLQIWEIKSMCSKYTITLDVWNEKQNFSSYFKVVCAFFYYRICDCNLFASYSVTNVLLCIWKYLLKSESSRIYIVFWSSLGILTEDFPFC